MTLSREDVAHVAMLARLGLDAGEQERLGAQLDAILDHILRLERVDVSDVAETAQVGGLVNVWREDATETGLSQEELLSAAPDGEDGRFRVGAIQE